MNASTLKITEDQVRTRTYFGPAELSQAADYLTRLKAVLDAWTVDGKATPIPVIMSPGLADGTVPDGFGILVKPNFERAGGGEKMRITHVAFATIPDITAVLASSKGAAFVSDIWIERVARRVGSLINNADGPVVFPTSLDGYLETGKRTSSLTTFNLLAPVYVKWLKEHGLKSITQPIFKALCMSADFARSLHRQPEEKGQFALILQRMIANGRAKQLDTSLLEVWLAERDETTMHAEELDLTDLI